MFMSMGKQIMPIAHRTVSRFMPLICILSFAYHATGATTTMPSSRPSTQRSKRPKLGISISDENNGGEQGKQMIKDFGGNLLVQAVVPHSLADQMGFKPGDVIKRINGKPVNTVPEVLQAINAADSFRVDILREKQEKTLSDGEDGL
jgi:S1-C subfamily serine protease